MVTMQASPSGMDGFRRKLEDLQRQIDSIRGAAFIKSSILRGDRIEFQTSDGDTFLVTGIFTTDESGTEHTNNGLAIYDPTGDIIVLAGHDETENRNDVQFGDPSERIDDFLVLSDDIRFGSEVSGLSGAFHADLSDEFDVDAPSIILDTPGGILQLQPDGDAILRSAPSQTLFLGNDVGTVTISADDTNIRSNGNVDIDPDGELRFFIGSHATPANLSISSNNVRIVSSALKYKADVEDIVVDRDVLLSMVGKTYVDKAEKEAGGEPTRYPGFIADEWAEHESLRIFVRFEDGEPEGFHYDRVTVAHHEVLRDHEARIAELEAEKAAMKADIAELKATVATLLKKPK